MVWQSVDLESPYTYIHVLSSPCRSHLFNTYFMILHHRYLFRKASLFIGGSEKSCSLKTATFNSAQADLPYLLRVINFVALKRTYFIEDLKSQQRKAGLTNLL